MKHDDIVIVAAKRTPLGNFLGSLASLSTPDLGAAAHIAAIAESGILPADIDEVISGCVLPAGLGQAPARQAAIHAQIPVDKGATTINKMCGSGMKAVMLAHDLIRAESANIVLASGMESMSNAPYLLTKARTGYRIGTADMLDHMMKDGLEDAYEGKSMGYYADVTARRYGFTREAQDEYATMSLARALAAEDSGKFKHEITPITISGKHEVIVNRDEGPSADKLAKIPRLKPAFAADGTVTAANSSSISDGAASLILMTQKNAEMRNLTPLARIVATASYAGEPAWFTTAPVTAIRNVLEKAGWTIDDVDLFEINEAFAVVAMAAIHDLELDIDRVNIHGGACALGHPIGASGARIIVTLLNALRIQNKTRGVASLCIGGGEATAIALELY